MLQFACILLVSATVYGAAAPGANAQNFNFSSVVVEGNGRVEPGTILSYAGIARGETVSAGQLNAAYQSVLGSGLFETATIVPTGSGLRRPTPAGCTE
jgi:outer membrane protein insertion porin family